MSAPPAYLDQEASTRALLVSAPNTRKPPPQVPSFVVVPWAVVAGTVIEAPPERLRRTAPSGPFDQGIQQLGWVGDGRVSQTAEAKLSRLSQLQPNWDGEEAPAIASAAITAARRALYFVGALVRPQEEPRIVPLANGELQLDRHAPDRSLEVEHMGGTWAIVGIKRGATPEFFSAEVPSGDEAALVRYFDWFELRAERWPSR